MVDPSGMTDATLLRALLALETEAARRRLIETKGPAVMPGQSEGRKP